MTGPRVGYACVNTLLPSASKTCRLANATPERIIELARGNLQALRAILEWNVANGIPVFRISSDTIPFGSHPQNTVDWRVALRPELDAVAAVIRRGKLRVTMHPGQFTVLNSPRAEVVQASVAEVEYHARLLDGLGAGRDGKIIVHFGGVFGDKAASLRRVAAGLALLGEAARQRVVIENDERCYHLADAVEFGRAEGVPVVFDVFHHACYPSLPKQGTRALVELAMATWRKVDGRPKLHYSEQAPGQPVGTHSVSATPRLFARYLREIADLPVDVMLEVKDKQQSVLCCRAETDLATREHKDPKEAV